MTVKYYIPIENPCIYIIYLGISISRLTLTKGRKDLFSNIGFIALKEQLWNTGFNEANEKWIRVQGTEISSCQYLCDPFYIGLTWTFDALCNRIILVGQKIPWGWLGLELNSESFLIWYILHMQCLRPKSTDDNYKL